MLAVERKERVTFNTYLEAIFQLFSLCYFEGDKGIAAILM